MGNIEVNQIFKYVIWFMFGSGLVCEIVPAIKFNPFSLVLGWIGRKLNRDLSIKVNILEKKLDLVENENDSRRIKDLKSEILNFSRELKRYNSEDIFDEEDYDKIFESYEEYEVLLKRHGLTNGKTSRAMELIHGHYNKKIGI